MTSFRPFLFLVLIWAAVGNVPTVESQDVSSFLSELMKNYMAKNTRHYTMVNGVPVQESENGPPDNKEIMNRISSILPPHIAHSPVLSQILEQDANSFPNSWTPMMAEVASSGNSYPPADSPPQQSHPYTTAGRRHGEEVQYRFAHQYLPEQSKIITVEDLSPMIPRGQPQDPTEFNIQSTMNFQ